MNITTKSAFLHVFRIFVLLTHSAAENIKDMYVFFSEIKFIFYAMKHVFKILPFS